jgi:hypothetical protein
MKFRLENTLIFKDPDTPITARDVEDYTEDYEQIQRVLNKHNISYNYEFGKFVIEKQQLDFTLDETTELFQTIREIFGGFKLTYGDTV